MKNKLKIMPKTKIGKYSFWITLIGFVLIYANYWAAMAFRISTPPFFGVLPMIIILISGISSLTAIVKYKDHSIFLFLSLLIWLLSITFVAGELIFPH